MKRIIAIALFSTATFITLGSALARAQTVEAKIPFAFIVQNQVLLAGTYRISSAGTNLVKIETRNKPVMEMITTYSYSKGLGSDSALLFNKYGDQYFLREILCESANIRSTLPASNLEKLARIREARIHSTDQIMAAVR
jgi:hypothetical protein